MITSNQEAVLITSAPNFLSSYLTSLSSLPGWFSADAALMFMAYNQLISAANITGDVLEIGVYHGKSAVALASLRRKGGKVFAIDLFEDMQSYGDSHSEFGMKAAFVRNMTAFHGKLDFLEIIARSSSQVSPAELGDRFSFCHIDGEHSQSQTYQDLELCHAVLLPGGLLAVDDYFNPLFPGVSEGAFKFSLDHPGELVPLAVGFNKGLFQKPHPNLDLNHKFAQAFPYFPRHVTYLWNQPVYIFLSELTPFVDLPKSTPRKFTPQADLRVGARVEPQVKSLTTKLGQPVSLPVRVVNQSSIDFAWGIALSYHLLSGDGQIVQWDNGRCIFEPALQPGDDRLVQLGIPSPSEAGCYQLELDLVWEGICWFKDKGNPTTTVDLIVQ
jgi:SAM-dependent methyltransferase